MENKIILLGLLIFSFACSPSYQQGRPGDLRVLADGYKSDQGPPRPFRFSYNNQDDVGGTSYHEAQGDETGKVLGSYGYTDADGLYRIVQYEADANGYRATIRTNEPGTEERNPADAVFVVEPVPQAVISRYDGQGLSAGLPSRGALSPAAVAYSSGYGPLLTPKREN